MRPIVSLILLLFGIALGVMAVGNVTFTRAAGETWSTTWTADLDHDYGRVYADYHRNNLMLRVECPQGMYYQQDGRWQRCGPIHPNRGDLANVSPFSPSPTVVRWNVSGVVANRNFSETWLPGDGTGAGVDFLFQEYARAGETGGRNHSFIYFTGQARLVPLDRGRDGGPLSLEYFWRFASEDGVAMRNCRPNNPCGLWLRWGQTTNYFNHDVVEYLRILKDIDNGQPTRWTVTGRVL